MSATAGSAEGQRSPVHRLGLSTGQTVQEIGYDDDCDDALRAAVVTLTGEDLVDEDYDGVVDAVLLWWREDDGDLVDALVETLVALADGGSVWLLTPKVGTPGHVDPADIADAAPTAGLATTTSLQVGPQWSGTRLVAPKARR